MDRRASTLRAARAGQTRRPGKLHVDDGMSPLVVRRFPFHAALAPGTGGLAGLPIKDKVLQSKARARAILPMVVLGGGADEVDAALRAADQVLRIHIAGVHQMLGWRPVVLQEGL